MIDFRHDTYDSMHQSIKDVLLSNPEISEAEAKEFLWSSMKDNKDIFRLLFDNWFNVNWRRYEPQVKEVVTKKGKKRIVGRSVTIVRLIPKQHQQSKEKRKIIAQKIIQNAAPTILMNLPMPNGKPLKDCTGNECSKFGGWFGLIAKAIKPKEIVGKHLTETDLQNLLRRNAA